MACGQPCCRSGRQSRPEVCLDWLIPVAYAPVQNDAGGTVGGGYCYLVVGSGLCRCYSVASQGGHGVIARARAGAYLGISYPYVQNDGSADVAFRVVASM